MVTDNWQPTKAEFWKNFPSPARPWPSEVAWFEKYVLDKKTEGKTDVLILGSTVEFRSMLHKNSTNVHVVDFSKKFYDILSEQPMQYKGKETFYEQDWRIMELGKKFDLIFGDWVPGVLDTKDYDAFFERILLHLKKDGLFIGREHLRPDRSVVDLEKAAKEHYAKYADKYSFYETCAPYMYAYKADPVTAAWNLSEIKKAIEDIYKKGILTEADHDFCVRALAVETHAASVMVAADFDVKVKKYFEIVAKHFGTEPTAPWYPIYVLKKK